MNLSGEVIGSVTTNFEETAITTNTYKTFTTVTSLSNLKFDKFLTVASIGANSNLSVSSSELVSVPVGAVREGHLLIRNTSSSNITVTIANDARIVTTNGNTMSIEGNGVGELNALITNDGTNYTIYIITN